METANVEELRKYIGYDPETGAFVWLQDRSCMVRAGDPAGTWNQDGYLCICFKGRRYRASRIAWALMTGKWPTDQIDHKDLNRANNRFGNFREATQRQNLLNRRRRKSSPGLKGVSACRRGKFRAVICLDGKQRHLGEFATPEAAHAAYVEAAKKLHGGFASFS